MLGARYVIDACSLMTLVERYPRPSFSSVWDMLGGAADEGIVIAPLEVLGELRKLGYEDVRVWAEAHKHMFVAPDRDVLLALRDVLAVFPKILKRGTSTNAADPFVVALALQIEDCTVVSEEQWSTSAERPKIPNLCAHFGLRSLNLAALIAEQGWQFVSSS